MEESVRLRDETVTIERRPVDRPATDADLAAGRDQTIEVTEVDEEAVVSKQARVVEEVVVRKDAESIPRRCGRRCGARTSTLTGTLKPSGDGAERLDQGLRHLCSRLAAASRDHVYAPWRLC